MKYYVLNGAKKYDNVQNEGKGWYRNWAVVLDLSSENGKKYVGYHSETYYWEGSGWEDNHHGPTYWSELPEDFYEKYHQVGGEECSEACEALWYKFKDDDEEKVEMENASTSVTREVINDMKKRYENMPTTSLKEVMGWLIEDKKVVYRPIHPDLPDGEVARWKALDSNKPELSDEYEYQLSEKVQETWSFRIPQYSVKASCREEAFEKAVRMITNDPAAFIVVYPGVHDNVI
jgi:hypothetical protein